jgi:hypothetical protein
MSGAQGMSASTLRWSIAAGVAAGALMGLVFGGLVMKLVVLVISLAILQGLWRGASEIAGVVLGLIAAALIAPLLGRPLQSAAGSLTGTDGLMARFIAMGLAAAVIVAVVAVVFRSAARRFIGRRPVLRMLDPYIGAALGLVEGCLLSMMLLWAPLALEPVARAQLEEEPPVNPPAARGSTPGQSRRNPVAQAVVGLADRVHGSSLGRIAERTNPVEGSELLALAADFSVVSRHPEAMAWLMESPVMQKIEALPSVREAVETLKQDPELVSAFDESGVTVETVKRMLNSPRVMDLLDRTTIVRDLEPLAPELADTIRKARARAEAERDGP